MRRRGRVLGLSTPIRALFLCQGTGTPGNPPRLCQAAASNGPVANDEDIFMAAVPIR